jgi:hypothetical protein
VLNAVVDSNGTVINYSTNPTQGVLQQQQRTIVASGVQVTD